MNKVRREALRKVVENIEAAFSELEELLGEEEEYRDNIPENMQGGERYEKAEEACDYIQESIDNLGYAIDNINSAIDE